MSFTAAFCSRRRTVAQELVLKELVSMWGVKLSINKPTSIPSHPHFETASPLLPPWAQCRSAGFSVVQGLWQRDYVGPAFNAWCPMGYTKSTALSTEMDQKGTLFSCNPASRYSHKKVRLIKNPWTRHSLSENHLYLASFVELQSRWVTSSQT